MVPLLPSQPLTVVKSRNVMIFVTPPATHLSLDGISFKSYSSKPDQNHSQALFPNPKKDNITGAPNSGHTV